MRWTVLLCIALFSCKNADKGAEEGNADQSVIDGAFENADGVQIVECNDKFQTCGGDIAGPWEVYAMCDPGVNTDVVCKRAEYTITRDRSTGTIDLRDDGTYERVYKVDVDYDVFVPDDCLGPLTCDLLSDFSGPILKRCKDKPKGCDCSGTFKTTLRGNGDWEKRGSTVVTEDGATEYCIDGDIADTVDPDGIRVLWRAL